MKEGSSEKSRFSVLVQYVIISLLAYVSMGFFALLLSIKTFNPLSNALMSFSFTDIYYQLYSEVSTPDTSQVVTIVDMTDIFSRGKMASLLEDIEAGQPKVIGVDVVFENEKDDFEGNDSLMTVVSSYDNIVFSVKFLGFSDQEQQYTQERHSFFVDILPIKEGFTNVPRGSLYDVTKRVVPRRATSKGKLHPSLVAGVLTEYTGQDMWHGDEEMIQVNFTPRKFVVLSPDEVRLHPELIHGRIVMLGAMYEDPDTHWTPIGKMAGVELLAYAVVTVLEKKEVYKLPFAMSCILAFLTTMLLVFYLKWFSEKTSNSSNVFVHYIIGSSYVSNILTFLLTSVLLGICFLVFMKTGLSLDLAWPLSSLAFISTGINMYWAIRNYISNKRKKQ